MAATIPNCKAYDPAFAGEMAVIIDHGMREMLVEQQDVFYYVTLMNENYAQPDLPAGAAADVIRGCYLFNSYKVPSDGGKTPEKLEKVTLMGSGAILTEVIKAAQLLAAEGIECDVFSVTSWSELARDGQACEQRAFAAARAEPVAALRQAQGERNEAQPERRGSPLDREETPFIVRQLAASSGPIIAATDYVRAVPESVRAWLPEGRRYLTLGTDGFGRSDTRAALRDFFGVDAQSIARAARYALQR